ncbi:MAG: hypothetical protein WCK09_17245 [Bacteroidota bacterium]
MDNIIGRTEEIIQRFDVIRALARKSSGLTRGEIIENCKLTSGGGLQEKLFRPDSG